MAGSPVSLGGSSKARFRPHRATVLPSVPAIFLMFDISWPYAERRAPEGAQGGRLPRLLLGRRRGAVLQPVRGLPADLRARGRDGHDVAGAPPARRQPDGRRPDARDRKSVV